MAAPLGLCRFRSHSPTLDCLTLSKRLFQFFTLKQQKKKSSKNLDIEFDNFSDLKTQTTVYKARSNARHDELDLISHVSGRQGLEGSIGPKKLKSRNTVSNDETSKANLSRAPPFKQVLQRRYQEAQRSVIVRSQDPDSTCHSLTQFGGINHVQFIMPEKNFLLVEFINESSLVKLQRNSKFFNEINQFPLKSRILCDTRSVNHGKRKFPSTPKMSEGNWLNKTSDHYPLMNTFDEELEALFARKSLDDCDLRLRFFTCMMIEDIIKPILPDSRVVPYGSCMNGFGWWSSDLDMMLCFNSDLHTSSKSSKAPGGNSSSQFKFMTETFASDRHLAQRTLAMVSALLELSPRIHNMIKILGARVPIIRFKHGAVDLLCDISIHQIDSIKMTELLYLLSVSDPRVRPLMFAIKQWAICHDLTASGEQQKPTTIGLLTMLIFYLQTLPSPVVPTFRQLQALAGHSETFCIDNITFGLPSNPALIPKSDNKQSLESLLHGFFEFYSKFDFANKSISITEGATFSKSVDSRPVCIENPLCVSLNICQNIGVRQLEILTSAMADAALKIESFSSSAECPEPRLTSLLSEKPLASKLSLLFTSSSKSERSLSFEDLLGEESDEHNTQAMVSDNAALDGEINQMGSQSLKHSTSTESDSEITSVDDTDQKNEQRSTEIDEDLSKILTEKS